MRLLATASCAWTLTLCPVGLASPAHAQQSVVLGEVPEDNDWQEARGEVAAPPERVHRWMLDYAGWPLLFSDVAWVQLLRREGPASVVLMRSRLFRRTLELRVEPTADGFRYQGRDGSITTEGRVRLKPAGERCTTVLLQNTAHIGGFLGLLAPRRMIRSRLRAKLRIDITDLQRFAERQLVPQTTSQ